MTATLSDFYRAHYQALPIREVLEDPEVAIKVGVVDSCRGGGWTATKGMSVAAPFPIEVPLNLNNEGSVFIASSSGLESAHEAEALKGSFFTLHFVAGLRGAADSNHDGEVTLGEAFEFAKDMTVRDTVRCATQPQHPSYDMHLRGRQDLVLTKLAQGSSTVTIVEHKGPLELIHADSGLRLLALKEGTSTVKVVLPPGRYFLRRTGSDGNFIDEFVLSRGAALRIDESQLVKAGYSALAYKVGLRRPLERSVNRSLVRRDRLGRAARRKRAEDGAGGDPDIDRRAAEIGFSTTCRHVGGDLTGRRATLAGSTATVSTGCRCRRARR